MPKAKTKKIIRDLDMDIDQSMKRTSTTAVFWIRKSTTRPDKTRLNTSFAFAITVPFVGG
jgi:hypothetical protein